MRFRDGEGPAEVLRIGDPRLRMRSAPVGADRDLPSMREDFARLHATLRAFRAEHGFGRAIAAPQIGVARRFVAANFGDGPRTLIDPEITARSEETFELWDDCMSFPELWVRVRRHAHVSVRYVDEQGAAHELHDLPRDLSELLQHEFDHLDGILAVDRAIDADSLRPRTADGLRPPLPGADEESAGR